MVGFHARARSHFRISAITSAALFLAVNAATAAVFTYTGAGGDSWDTSTISWDNAGATAWVNASPPNTATFNTTATTVATTGTLQVGGINFNTTGWIIGPGGTLTTDTAGGTIAIALPAGIIATLSPNISNNTGVVGVSVSGGGTLVQNAGSTNSYTGNTTISGGSSVQVGSSSSFNNGFGNNSASVILDNGTIIGGTVLSNPGNNHPILLGAGGGAIRYLGSGTLTLSGIVGDNGALVNPAGFTINAGAVSIAAANTFSGGLTRTNGNSTISVNQNYTGTTSILASGTITLNSGITINAATPQPLNLAGGTLILSGTRTVNQTFSGTTLDPGMATITQGNYNGTTGTATALGAITRNAGSVLNFGTLPTVGNITTATPNAAGTQTILGGYAIVNVAANTWTWAVSGSGGVAGNITGLSSFTGSLASGGDVDLAPTSTTNFSQVATTLNSLRFNGTSQTTLTLTSPMTITTGGILVGTSSTSASAPATAINGSTITSGNGQDLIITDSSISGGHTITIGSQIVGSGIGLTWGTVGNRGNTLLLTAANTFDGDTNINSTTLSIGNQFALQNSTVNLTSRAATLLTPAPALAFSTGITTARLGGLKGNGNITLQTSNSLGVDLNVGNNSQPTTYAGVLSNGASSTGALTKLGTGTLTLTGKSTITGPTTVRDGVLVVGTSAGGSLLSSPVTARANATLAGVGTVLSLSILLDGHGAPGNSIGTQGMSAFAMESGANLDFEFAAPGASHTAPGSGDRYAVTAGASAITIPGSGVLLNLVGSGASLATGSYEIISYTDTAPIANFAATTGNISGGTITPNANGSIILGTGWNSLSGNISYSIVNDTARQGVFVDLTATGVPEPASLSLLALGAAALLTRRRQR